MLLSPQTQLHSNREDTDFLRAFQGTYRQAPNIVDRLVIDWIALLRLIFVQMKYFWVAPGERCPPCSAMRSSLNATSKPFDLEPAPWSRAAGSDFGRRHSGRLPAPEPFERRVEIAIKSPPRSPPVQKSHVRSFSSRHCPPIRLLSGFALPMRKGTSTFSFLALIYDFRCSSGLRLENVAALPTCQVSCSARVVGVQK